MEVSTAKTDETLVSLAQSGDKQAQDELLLRYAALVRGQARRFFLMDGETEDLIQEGMIGLYHAVRDYHEAEGKSFKNFAFLCVRRRIIDAVKRASSKKIPPKSKQVSNTLADTYAHGLPSLDDELILFDEWQEFRQKMSSMLSDFEFKIFTMYMDGMSCVEICRTTGKTQKSVDNALQRSKRKLRPLLD